MILASKFPLFVDRNQPSLMSEVVTGVWHPFSALLAKKTAITSKAKETLKKVSSSLGGVDSPKKMPSGRDVSVFSHEPVLFQEVVTFLKPKPGMVFLDGTLGGGGHTELLLQAGARVVACDRDPAALAHARERLAGYGDRFLCFEGNYADAAAHLPTMGITHVDGILLDLGVSSHQLDTAERGFSFQREGPLDMRMGHSGRTAADIVNNADLAELVAIFRNYGDEPRAMTFATRIIRERQQRPITTTTALASLIALGVRPGPRHPATRVFQALRIAVNEEISSLERALPLLTDVLMPQGRLAVITFHSLEDRIVKRFFKKHAMAEVDDPTWPAAKPNPDQLFSLPLPHSIVAGSEELQRNRRSRSARLRMAERLPLISPALSLIPSRDR